jgi:hypothetical protein
VLGVSCCPAKGAAGAGSRLRYSWKGGSEGCVVHLQVLLTLSGVNEHGREADTAGSNRFRTRVAGRRHSILGLARPWGFSARVCRLVGRRRRSGRWDSRNRELCTWTRPAARACSSAVLGYISAKSGPGHHRDGLKNWYICVELVREHHQQDHLRL